MNPIKLTIILPCYNVEKYIAECLDSLYRQDISEEEYEVICVNDCSPDGTRDIILNYQQKHSNLILIDHEVNKRQGGARNTGIKAAKGEYIWFVDPDDYIKTNVLNSILDSCFENNLDILQFNYDKVTINGEFQFKKENVINTIVMNGIEFTNSLGNNYLNNYDLSVCTRLIKSDYFKTNNIIFIENTIFEDLVFSLRTMMFCKRIMAISDSLYLYRYNPDSTMNELNNIIKGSFTFQTCFIIGSGIIDLAKDINRLDKKQSEILYNAGIWRINRISKPLIKATNKERKIFLDMINKDSTFKKSILQYLNPINKIFIKHQKISIFILSLLVSPLFKLVRKL